MYAHREIGGRDPAIPKHDASEREVDGAGMDGPRDGRADHGGMLAAVGLADEEQRAAPQSPYLPGERPEELDDVLGRLKVRRHQGSRVLRVAVADAYWAVLWCIIDITNK